jgi:hypothetical protein
MIGIATWIGLDLDTSRWARVKGSDGRFELDGAPGEAASKITLDVAGEEENGDATTTRRGAWPDGDVRPMGPGMLGPTRGPCRPKSMSKMPITTSTIDAIHHHAVIRRRSRVNATPVNLLGANSTPS